MSQKMQDLQAALEAERANHALTRTLLVTARAALNSEALAHEQTRAVLTTTQGALNNVMTDHVGEVQAHIATTEEVERLKRRVATAHTATVTLAVENRDLDRKLTATLAVLTHAQETRNDALAFAMQF
jgi:hypothetical protein